jgi:hypothetical protein
MRSRLRDAEHLVRLALVFAAGVVLFLVVRAGPGAARIRRARPLPHRRDRRQRGEAAGLRRPGRLCRVSRREWPTPSRATPTRRSAASRATAPSRRTPPTPTPRHRRRSSRSRSAPSATSSSRRGRPAIRRSTPPPTRRATPAPTVTPRTHLGQDASSCRSSATTARLALRAGLPGRRHLREPGRRRAGRQGLLHRLPLLRAGLPLRLPLHRSAHQHGRQVHALLPPDHPKGLTTACCEVCPTGARMLADLKNPKTRSTSSCATHPDPGAEAADGDRLQGLLQRPRRLGALKEDRACTR